MSKERLYNSLIAFFAIITFYHLPACTVDTNATSSTTTSSTGDLTNSSGSGSTGDLTSSSGSSSTGDCGDCQKDPLEECDFCEYKSSNEYSFCAKENWPLGSDTGKCTVAYTVTPQFDCLVNWTGEKGCNIDDAHIFCQIFLKNEKAKMKEGGWIVGDYAIARGLISLQSVNNKNVELISIPDSIYPEVFYYDENPYLVSIPTAVISEQSCIIE